MLGQGIESLASELTDKKLDHVYAVEHDLLKDYTPDTYTPAVRQLVEKTQASVVIFPHTYQVRDFLPKLATALGRVAVSDVIAHRIEDGKLVLVRQLFQGKLNVDVRFTGDPPYFASLQAGAYRADQVMEGSAPVEKFTPQIQAGDIRTKPLGRTLDGLSVAADAAEAENASDVALQRRSRRTRRSGLVNRG